MSNKNIMKCEQCKMKFVAKKYWQRFCSQGCRNKWNYIVFTKPARAAFLKRRKKHKK